MFRELFRLLAEKFSRLSHKQSKLLPAGLSPSDAEDFARITRSFREWVKRTDTEPLIRWLVARHVVYSNKADTMQPERTEALIRLLGRSFEVRSIVETLRSLDRDERPLNDDEEE